MTQLRKSNFIMKQTIIALSNFLSQSVLTTTAQGRTISIS